MDLNGDGHLDILSGSYSGDDLPEMAGLFQVLWGEKGGTFRKAEALEGTDGELLIIKPADQKGGDQDTPRICTRPTAVDYDGDGDLDLFVGNFKGTYYVFRGEGSGKFSPKSERVMQGEKPLSTGYHSDPCFADWDGDGDLDLFAGSGNGGVTLVENTAGKGKEMSFGKSIQLVEAPKERGARWADDEFSPASSTRVWVDDLNGDGKPDLLVGDSVRLQSLPDGVTREESEKALAKWNEEMRAFQKLLRKEQTQKEMAEIHERYSKHFDKRGKFLKEESTGFVWVYYQK